MTNELDPILFELRLLETNVTTGSVPITWCVNRDWLIQHSDEELYIAFSVAPPNPSGWRIEWRGFVKLSTMVAYIPFYRPGKNRIIAVITSSKSYLQSLMMKESNSDGWRNEVMNFSDTFEVPNYLLNKRWIDNDNNLWTYIDIDLPSECFAKEPSEFEQWWVEFLFAHSSKDQCQFRRRRIFAYTIQPFLFLLLGTLYFVSILIAHLFNLMNGKWTIWKNIIHNIYEVDEFIDFLTVKKFYPLHWIFKPILWISAIAFIIAKLSSCYWIYFSPIIYLVTVSVGWFGIFGMISIAKATWVETATGRSRKSSTSQSVIPKPRKKELLPKDIELLFCSNKPITSIKDLPRSKKTIRLRFQGIKASICQPFAK